MLRTVKYKGITHDIKIEWSGSLYVVMVNGKGSRSIPMDCLDDIEKIKPYIIEAIENSHDLKTIEIWDGNLDSPSTDIIKNENAFTHEIATKKYNVIWFGTRGEFTVNEQVFEFDRSHQIPYVFRIKKLEWAQTLFTCAGIDEAIKRIESESK